MTDHLLLAVLPVCQFPAFRSHKLSKLELSEYHGDHLDVFYCRYLYFTGARCKKKLGWSGLKQTKVKPTDEKFWSIHLIFLSDLCKLFEIAFFIIKVKYIQEEYGYAIKVVARDLHNRKTPWELAKKFRNLAL